MCEFDIERLADNETINRPTNWAAIKAAGCQANGVQTGYYFLLKDPDDIGRHGDRD